MISGSMPTPEALPGNLLTVLARESGRQSSFSNDPSHPNVSPDPKDSTRTFLINAFFMWMSAVNLR